MRNQKNDPIGKPGLVFLLPDWKGNGDHLELLCRRTIVGRTRNIVAWTIRIYKKMGHIDVDGRGGLNSFNATAPDKTPRTGLSNGLSIRL